jgi:hypothetical protein
MTMSFISTAGLTGAVVISEFALSGSLDRLMWIFGSKAILLGVGVAICFAHWAWARRQNTYTSKSTVRPKGWSVLIWTYAGVSAALLAAAISVAFLASRGRT